MYDSTLRIYFLSIDHDYIDHNYIDDGVHDDDYDDGYHAGGLRGRLDRLGEL